MQLINCTQNSSEWISARCGIPSASNFDKIVTSKGEPSKQRTKYMWQLAGERIAKRPEESYQNVNMIRGTEMQSEAKSLYEIINDVSVQEVGFCLDDSGKYGASPDGLIDDCGGLEIKCPLMSTHIGYLLDGTIPTDYIQQVQGNLLVTGREWWDFKSYYPAIKPLIVRVYPDDKFLKLLKSELVSFCEELETVVKKIGG